ncbi:hypothetical protein Tco_1052352, partial [Tanacetum coccineum]
VDAYVVACESSSDVGIYAIHQIVGDTIDRLVPFKDKLDFYRLELSGLLASQFPRQSKNKGTGCHSRFKNMDELIQNEAESSKKR